MQTATRIVKSTPTPAFREVLLLFVILGPVLLLLPPSPPAAACGIYIPSATDVAALETRAAELAAELAADAGNPRRMEGYLEVEARLLETQVQWIAFGGLSGQEDEGAGNGQDAETIRTRHRERLLPVAEAWLRLEPESLAARRALASLQATDEARLALFQDFVDRHPHHAAGLRSLVETLSELGHEGRAHRLAEAFLARHRDDPEAYRILQDLVGGQDQERYEALRREVRQRFPNDPWVLLGWAELDEILVRGLLERQDLERELIRDLFWTAIGLESTELAFESFERLSAREVVPGDLDPNRAELALLFYQKGEIERAEEIFFGTGGATDASPRARLDYALRLAAEEHCGAALSLLAVLEEVPEADRISLLWDCGRRPEAAASLVSHLWSGAEDGHLERLVYSLPKPLWLRPEVMTALRRRVEVEPGSRALHRGLHYLLENGDEDRALAQLLLWADLTDDDTPLAKLAVIFRDRGQRDQAEAMLREAVRRRPLKDDHARQLTELLEDYGPERLTAVGRHLQEEGHSFAAHRLLAAGAFEAGRFAEAVEHLRAAQALADSSAVFADWYLESDLIEALREADRRPAAESVLVARLERRGDGDDAIIGAHLRELEMPERAVPYLRRAVEQQPWHARRHGELGLALAASGAPREAEAALLRSIELDPYPDSDVVEALAEIYLEQRRYREAVALFRKHGVEAYGDGETLFAAALTGAGHAAEAVERLRPEFAERKNEFEMARTLAAAYQVLEQPEEARTVLQGFLTATEPRPGQECSCRCEGPDIRAEAQQLLAAVQSVQPAE